MSSATQATAAAGLTPGITISRCNGCGAGYFPTRLICPRCGSASMRADKVHDAVVEESTCVRHAAAQENWSPKHLATVRTPESQVIVVGLEGPLAAGTRIKLFEEGMAPYGRIAEGSR
jgi:uncharacterized OB-fold protein